MTEEELMDKSFDDLIEYEDNLKKEWEKAKKELKDIVHSKYFDFVEDNETYSSEGLVNIEKTDDKVHGYPKGECCKIKGEYKLYLKTKMYLETLEGNSKYEGKKLKYYVNQTTGYLGDDYYGHVLIPTKGEQYWKVSYSC